MARREWAGVRRGKRAYQALLDRARLTPDEACAIGVAATDRGKWCPPVMASLRDENGRLLWLVTDCVIGASTSVELDDATGAVLAVRRHSGR